MFSPHQSSVSTISNNPSQKFSLIIIPVARGLAVATATTTAAAVASVGAVGDGGSGDSGGNGPKHVQTVGIPDGTYTCWRRRRVEAVDIADVDTMRQEEESEQKKNYYKCNSKNKK